MILTAYRRPRKKRALGDRKPRLRPASSPSQRLAMVGRGHSAAQFSDDARLNGQYLNAFATLESCICEDKLSDRALVVDKHTVLPI